MTAARIRTQFPISVSSHQPSAVRHYSICDDHHTYIHTSPRDIASIHPVVRDPKHGEREDSKHRTIRDSRHGEASRNRERPCEVPVGDSFEFNFRTAVVPSKLQTRDCKKIDCMNRANQTTENKCRPVLYFDR